MITHNDDQRRFSVEDLLLTLLGLLSGPILLWMSRQWSHMPAASSLKTFEFWVATVAGMVGVFLAALWLMFLIAGVLYAIGLKTRNTVLTYWSSLFTPKFLRRLFMSVMGIQLAISSQAIASPTPEVPTETTATSENAEVFMPEIVTEHNPLPETNTTEQSPQQATATPSDVASEVTEAPSDAVVVDNSAVEPQPRQTSTILVQPPQEVEADQHSGLEELPRQISTVPVIPKQLGIQENSASSPDMYRPQQPVTAPYLGSVPQARDSGQNIFVIRDGDCLWDIAHTELGADATLFEIDERWRQWWEHNRSVLGDDPHVLKPGTVLSTPPFVK